MEIINKLKQPFPPNQVHWRVGNVSKKNPENATALAYLDARDVMKRLDDVCGVNWQCEYTHAQDGLVICKIGIKIDNEWLWRSNGAGESNFEGKKGSCSDAFKRAAVLWGIGRYLYYLDTSWVKIDQYKNIINPPNLPDWALPK